MGGRGGGREGEEDMYVSVPLNFFIVYKSEGVSEGRAA